MDDKVLRSLYETVLNRRENQKEGSYTCYLFEKGLDKRSEKTSNLKTFHKVDKNT